MSDYHVYVDHGSENVEYEIPDIYRDSDSETNSDQIKTYISNLLNIDYNNISIDINRKGKVKKKCIDYEILDGDDIYIYFVKIDCVNIENLKLKSGSANMANLKYNTYNFKEKYLNSILSDEEDYRQKVENILNIMKDKIKKFNNNTDEILLDNFLTLIIMKYVPMHSSIYPFSINGDYHIFCNLDKDNNPIGFGYVFNLKTNTYYQGNFVKNLIYNCQCISLNNNPYFIVSKLFIDYTPIENGIKKFLTHNEVFIGNFNNGLYSIYGNLITDDGSYIGNFKDGLKFCFGHMTYKNGDSYTGFWSFNKKSNFGKMKYSNGDYYIGTWYEDKKEEFGLFYDKQMNITYIGTFKDDKETFISDEFTLVNGYYYPSDFMGEYEIKTNNNENNETTYMFSKQVFNCEKLLITHSKDITQLLNLKQSYYVGNYDYLGECYGFGKLYINRTNKIINNNTTTNDITTKEYIDEKFKGFDCYYCNFIESYPNGFGMIKCNNGNVYIGNIFNSKFNGYGTLFKKNGIKLKGFWNNNKLVHKSIK
jgi:hypothetical protein